MSDYLAAYAGRMPPCAERLAGVSLECRDALDVIDEYGRHEDVLLYCDPPYLAGTRSRNYRREMGGEREHRALATLLKTCRAHVMLSGYPSPLYDDLYAGWFRHDLAAWTGNASAGGRTEVVWSNRPLGDPALFNLPA